MNNKSIIIKKETYHSVIKDPWIAFKIAASDDTLYPDHLSHKYLFAKVQPNDALPGKYSSLLFRTALNALVLKMRRTFLYISTAKVWSVLDVNQFGLILGSTYGLEDAKVTVPRDWGAILTKDQDANGFALVETRTMTDSSE